jgi:hypothetical protein
MSRTDVVPVGGNWNYSCLDAICPITTTLTYNKKWNEIQTLKHKHYHWCAENKTHKIISHSKNNGICSVGGNKFENDMVLLPPSYEHHKMNRPRKSFCKVTTLNMLITKIWKVSLRNKFRMSQILGVTGPMNGDYVCSRYHHLVVHLDTQNICAGRSDCEHS